LKWDHHINNITKELKFCKTKFYFIRNKCPPFFQKVIYNALVNSKLNYGIICWGGAYHSTIKIAETAQKGIIRIISKKGPFETSFPIFCKLKLLPLKHLYIYKVLRVFFMRSGNTPRVVDKPHVYYLRNSLCYVLPKPRTTLFKRCFIYMGAKMFNALPGNIKCIKIKNKFLRCVKSWLFEQKNVQHFINC
jgi:hypothetical protein